MNLSFNPQTIKSITRTGVITSLAEGGKFIVAQRIAQNSGAELVPTYLLIKTVGDGLGTLGSMVKAKIAEGIAERRRPDLCYGAIAFYNSIERSLKDNPLNVIKHILRLA